MKIRIIVFVAVFILGIVAAPPSFAETKFKANSKPAHVATKWLAGKYHDVVVGRATKADIVRTFGNPDETRKPLLTVFAGEQCCEELVYHGKSDSHGDLVIAIRKKGAVVYVLDQFPRASPRSTAYKQFGQDWRERAYSTASCTDADGATPLYLDPAGPVTLIEYPKKGIVLFPAAGTVDFFGAVYLAKAPGGAKPACGKK